jgi:hypothetical protein
MRTVLIQSDTESDNYAVSMPTILTPINWLVQTMSEPLIVKPIYFSSFFLVRSIVSPIL